MDAGSSPEPLGAVLLDWYARQGRHDLPWRHTRDPYALWLAEIMLQQTQVASAMPYYERFLARFPTLEQLAGADLNDVLHLWTGLGYYARARNLHACARQVVARHGGRFPQDMAAMMALPGIGRSTAGAILSSAYDASHPILDGNVKRVLARYHAFEGDPASRAGETQLWEWAARHTPVPSAHLYNQAIQDLGALICRRSQPQCLLCPAQTQCQAHARNLSASLPRPRQRIERPTRQAWFGMIRNMAGEILLQQQGPTGLWGGLWVLPAVARLTGATPEHGLTLFADKFAMPLVLERVWPMARHSFSHFHLDYIPLQCSVDESCVPEEEGEWVKADAPGIRGLARPTQRLLDALARTQEAG